MTQPFIDCAIELAERRAGRGHRQHRVRGRRRHRAPPVGAAARRSRPPNGYAAKFSTPFCMAVGFLDRKAGFAQFTDERVMEPEVLALAAKVSYVIDPHDEYPQNFSGHIRATLKDGTVREVRKPHMRGGAHEPLTDEEIQAKFLDNLQLRRLGHLAREAARAKPSTASSPAGKSICRWRGHEHARARRPSRPRHRERAQHRPRHRARARRRRRGGRDRRALGHRRRKRSRARNRSTRRAGDRDPRRYHRPGGGADAPWIRRSSASRDSTSSSTTPASGPKSPLEQLSLETWRQVMAVTLEGPLLLVQAALTALERRQRHDRQYRRADGVHGRRAPSSRRRPPRPGSTA